MSTIDLLDTTDLAAAVRGPVFAAGDPGLDAEIAGAVTTYPTRPAVVIGATCTDDVAAAVRWAAERGLGVAVQATGHGRLDDLAGAVVVTTTRMDDVTVDPAARTATVGAGARWRAVIDAAAPHGLAALTGSASQVGVVGYTTGGGLGPLGRKHGFAADHVVSAQLVTADGEVRTVDADNDPELFWAIRGGKSSFGVVTELVVGLVPVATLYGGGIFYPGSAAADVLHAYRQWAPTLTEDTTTSVAVLRLPPSPELPEPLRGRTVVHLRVAHLGGADDGAALLAPMRSVAPALMDTVGEMPFAAVDAIHMDPTDPMPVHYQGLTLRDLTAEAVDALLAVAGPDVEVPLMLVEIRQLGGALARPAAVPNAVAGRDGAYSLWVLGPMFPPIADVVPAVVEGVVGALRPWAATGSLLNFHGTPGLQEVGTLWGGEDLARLREIKAAVDPGNVFRHGQVVA